MRFRRLLPPRSMWWRMLLLSPGPGVIALKRTGETWSASSFVDIPTAKDHEEACKADEDDESG